MGLLSSLVIEVTTVGLQCCQQCHHLPEYLLVSFRKLGQPPLKQGVVADVHVMHYTTYVVRCMANPNQSAFSPRTERNNRIHGESPTPSDLLF